MTSSCYPPVLKDDDVLEASTSQSASASGATVPGRGSLLYPGGVDEMRSMVAEHERLHMDLNAHSSFGALLVRLGREVDRMGSDQGGLARHARLGELVECCRTTHEVYATPISLWHTVLSADDALDSYPGYRTYLELGRKLCHGFLEWSMAAEYLIVAACWVAMQIPLHELLKGTDEDTLEPATIPDVLRPDVRLQQIVDRRNSLDFTWLAKAVPEPWLAERAIDVSRTGLAFLDSFTETCIGISLRLYLQYGKLLESLGMPVLEWDGHCKYTTRRVADTPHPPALLSRSIEGTSAEYVSRTVKQTLRVVHPRLSLETHEQERLVRREPAGPLYARDITNFLAQSNTDWALVDFVADTLVPHILIVSRPVELLIEQYSPDARTVAVLRAAARDGVVTAVRMIGVPEGGGEIFTVLALLTEYKDLRLLSTLPTDPQRYPPDLISSISLSCMFARGWSDYWTIPLQIVTSPVAFCDVLPSSWMTMLEASEEDVDLAFITVLVKPSPGYSLAQIDSVGALVAECADAEGALDRWTVFFGSQGVIGSIAGALTYHATIKASTSAEVSRPTSPAGVVLARLSSEETWFDPAGMSYVKAQPVREPQVDQGVLQLCVALRRSLRARQAMWRRDWQDRQSSEER